ADYTEENGSLTWFAFALLSFLLCGLGFTWTTRGWRRSLNLRRRDLRLRLRCRRPFVFRLWWRWQGHLFKLGFCRRARRQSFFFVLLRIGGGFSAFSREFSLTLFEEFSHVFRHVRRLLKIFLRLVLEEGLHEVDEHRQRAVRAGHVFTKRFLL